MNATDKEILRLAVPSIVTNVTVPLLGLVDLAIVGHVGNETMIGAIAVGSMIFNVMYWLMGFLRMSTSGLTAQEYGALDGSLGVQECRSLEVQECRSSGVREYRHSDNSPLFSILHRALRLALLIAVAFLLLQVPIRWAALWLMGPTEEVASLVRAYYNICIWGAPAVLSLNVMTGWFIGMQDTRTPMVVSVSQNVINILMSLLLVFGLHMQIEGVALGTLIAQWSGALMAVVFVLRRKNRSKSQIVQKKKTLFEVVHGAWTACTRAWYYLYMGHGQKQNDLFPRSFFQTNRDLFLRTLCLVAVNFFFTAAGARQGDLLLSVNTLLMTFFTLFSYIMDGFAFAGEALSGKHYGAYLAMKNAAVSSSEARTDAGDSPLSSFHTVNRHLFRWGWLMVVLFTVAYAIGGGPFLAMLTSESSVVDAAQTYLPWVLLIPVSGMAAFVYDGIFVGMMNTRGMLVSCAIATAAFFLLHYLLFPLWGNHALWIALITYLALRGILQYFIVRKE